MMCSAKGVGKSTIAERAVEGKTGVLWLKITTASSRDDVMRLLIKACNAEMNPDIVDFIAALMKGESKEGTLPIIILVVERSESQDQSLGIQAERGFPKELSAACNIIIISSANALLEFGIDHDREYFIFVGELSELEAREYILKLKLALSDEEIKHVMDNIGTNPAT